MDLVERYAKQFDDWTDVGVCIFDAQGHFLYVNNTFLKIRNVSSEEYLGLTPYDLYDNKLTDKCVLDSVYKTRATTTDVQIVASKDGQVIRKHLVTIRPVFDDAGEISCFIGYYKDLDSFNKEYDSSGAPAHTPEGDLRFRDWLEGKRKDPPFVAKSPIMVQLCRTAKQVADIGSTVLLTGETGTGKEVFASYIHNISNRKNHSFIVVDCTSLPEALMESELFGYEKGTFTGALSSGKKGMIESANGGTLFLDEINSLPLSLQGKLLRVIETKSIKKLGAVKPQPVDFRLIVATNVDLTKCIEDKTFRSDLYYRLNVLPFHLPPLRERREDIIPLAKRFLEEFQQAYGIRREFSPQVFEELLEYDWPGNVRELRNFVERSVVMGNVKLEEHRCLQQETRSEPSPSIPKLSPLAGVPAGEEEKALILAALAANGHHREHTAQALGISRRTLQYKLKKYNIT